MHDTSKRNSRQQRHLPTALEPLTQIDQWVTWRLVVVEGKNPSKVPYQCNGKLAKTGNPHTWATFDEVCAASDKIGFVLRGSGIGAIDLDDCFDPDTEKVAQWAQRIVDDSNGAYVEVTPSQRGLRIIGHATGGEVHTNWSVGGGKVEVYRDATRYITITGNVLGKAPKALTNIDHLIDDLVRNKPPPKAEGGRDETGSGYGFRFALDCVKDGMTQRKFKAAIMKDKGPAGEWARRAGDRQLDRAWQRARAGGDDSNAERPEPLGDAAYHGIAGELTRLIEPHTESDPALLLISTLVMYGNSIGRSAHFMVEETRHYANEFVVGVGRSSTARKGTAIARIRAFFRRCEESSSDNDPWMDRVKGGLSTGEGLILQFVDPKVKEGQPSIPVDKRLMIIEEEFASALIAMNRPDNRLSGVLRGAWDWGHLSNLTKNDPLEARDAHLSIIANVTQVELRRRLNDTERSNGFANRFLWFLVERSKLLPHGGDVVLKDLYLVEAMIKAQKFGRTAGVVKRDKRGERLWEDEYEHLSRDRVGLAGEICNRAAAHVVRLSMIYALLDRSPMIREEHLRAALEVWRYCEDSVQYIFGATIGNPFADTIDRAIHERRSMTRMEIWRLFDRNCSSNDIDQALAMLEQAGRIRRSETIRTGKQGRPKEKWEAN